jgi:hypothetical protein
MTPGPNDPPSKPEKRSIVDLLACDLPDEPFDTLIQRPLDMGRNVDLGVICRRFGTIIVPFPCAK